MWSWTDSKVRKDSWSLNSFQSEHTTLTNSTWVHTSNNARFTCVIMMYSFYILSEEYQSLKSEQTYNGTITLFISSFIHLHQVYRSIKEFLKKKRLRFLWDTIPKLSSQISFATIAIIIYQYENNENINAYQLNIILQIIGAQCKTGFRNKVHVIHKLLLQSKCITFLNIYHTLN